MTYPGYPEVGVIIYATLGEEGENFVIQDNVTIRDKNELAPSLPVPHFIPAAYRCDLKNTLAGERNKTEISKW